MAIRGDPRLIAALCAGGCAGSDIYSLATTFAFDGTAEVWSAPGRFHHHAQIRANPAADRFAVVFQVGDYAAADARPQLVLRDIDGAPILEQVDVGDGDLRTGDKPAVAWQEDGTLDVAWQGANGGVHFRKLDGSGLGLAPAVTVVPRNGWTAGGNLSVDLVPDGLGGDWMSWWSRDDRGGAGVLFGRWDGAGFAGGQLASVNRVPVAATALAAGPDGPALVWVDVERRDDCALIVSTFDAAGVELVRAEVAHASAPGEYFERTAIARAPNGRLAVAAARVFGDLDHREVALAFLDRDGAPEGGPLAPLPDVGGSHDLPVLDFLDDDRLLVSWDSDGNAPPATLWTAILDAWDGTLVDGPWSVSQGTASARRANQSIARLPDGRLRIGWVWDESPAGLPTHIGGRTATLSPRLTPRTRPRRRTPRPLRPRRPRARRTRTGDRTGGTRWS